MDGLQQAARRERANGGGRSHRREASRRMDIPAPAFRPSPMPSGDSANGSSFGSRSPPRVPNGVHGSNGHGAPAPTERRRRRSRNASMAQGEGLSVVSAAVAAGGAGWKQEEEEAGGGGGGSSFRENSNAMEDDERETLLSLLSGAYGQVNELTDELKTSLDKLQETEKELRECSRSKSNSQLLPKNALPPTDGESAQEVEVEDTMDSARGKEKPVSNFLKGMFPNDEGTKSTPANVRQLQMEVQRLRQRVTQANAKEEKYRADLARSQRLMAVMEAQVDRAGVENGTAPSHPAASRDGNRAVPYAQHSVTPGGTHYQGGSTKPLVDRVAELEEKLVKCSMENATAKQDHLTAKLQSSQLEKNTQRLRHELAKSRAMNDLLQNEIDRLQGTMSPEGEADGKGWRRWLGGLQEPLSPEPNPIRVSGDSDSPVVVVRDLDNNQLVYAPGRSDFM